MKQQRRRQARALGEAADDLAAANQRLIPAHDIGEVRDVLRMTDVPAFEVYRTVAEAVAAAGTEPGTSAV